MFGDKINKNVVKIFSVISRKYHGCLITNFIDDQKARAYDIPCTIEESNKGIQNTDVKTTKDWYKLEE